MIGVGLRSIRAVVSLAIAATQVSCASSPSAGRAAERPGIHGQVVDSGGPLHEVKITTEPATDVRLTEQGRYSITIVAATGAPIAPGKYRLTAFKVGWKPATIDFEYDGDGVELPEIVLVNNSEVQPALEPDIRDKKADEQAPSNGGLQVTGE